MFVQNVWCELRTRKDCEGYFSVESGSETPQEQELPSGWEYVMVDGELVVGCAKCVSLLLLDQNLRSRTERRN